MIDLYRHQKIALSFLRTNNGFALFMEQGCGKTLPTLYRVLDLLKSGEIEDALVVAPKSTLGSWERDIELFNVLDREILNNNITLINYDKVWRKDKESPYFKAWGAIILDEAHYIKNRTSERSKFLLKIACMSKYKYILTGTPIGNGALEDIFAQLTFLDPYMDRGYVYSNIFKRHLEEVDPDHTYKGSYKEFLSRYCVLNMYHKPASYINIRELQDLINEYSYRVKKVDCLDLPDKLPDEIVKVELKEKEKRLYKRLATESAILEYEILAENPLARLVKLRQLCAGFITTPNSIIEVNNEKIEVLTEIINSYDRDKKLVIFAEFKYSINQIDKLLKKLKIKHIILDGDQKEKTIWRRFQADESIKIIVCQYKTASAGIDLFASDTIIYYEPTLSSNILEQSRDRIHRSGQVNKCSYIHLLTKGTIEVDIYRALAKYSDFSDKLFIEYLGQYTRSFNS